LLEGEQQTEDEAIDGIRPVEVIEVTTEGAAESFDAGGVPVGEVGESAFLDLTTFAVGLAEEDGGRGAAVRDGFNVHGNIIAHGTLKYNYGITVYMGTLLAPQKSIFFSANKDLPQISALPDGGRSV
jgi:hypothetical protein